MENLILLDDLAEGFKSGGNFEKESEWIAVAVVESDPVNFRIDLTHIR